MTEITDTKDLPGKVPDAVRRSVHEYEQSIQ
jgi:hypothetical protein